MNEAKDTDVASEAQGREVVVQKSHLLSETNVPEKIPLKVINLTHQTATGVKDRRMLVFNYAPNVGFELGEHIDMIIIRT